MAVKVIRSFKGTVLFIWCFMVCGSAYSQHSIFKKGEKICFLGNSITSDGGFFHNISLFYATRYPREVLTIFNAGIGGNWAADVIKRLDYDVLAYKPDWCVIDLGMNDVNRNLYLRGSGSLPDIQVQRQKSLEVFQENYENIVQILLEHKIKLILQTPTVYDQTAHLPTESLMGRNDGLKIYAAYVKELGKKYGLAVVDYWTIMQDITNKIQQKDPGATIVGPDRVHPGPVGHFIMGYEFLRSIQDQQVISKIEIELRANKSCTGRVENGKICRLMRTAQAVTFQMKGYSLPFPVMPVAAAALELVNFSGALNMEALRVCRLAAGEYQLKIDGSLIGTYSNIVLDKGINLSALAGTPQGIQAKKILALFQKYWQLEKKIRWLRTTEFYKLRPQGVFNLADAEVYFNKELAKLTDTTLAAYRGIVETKRNYLETGKNEQMLIRKMKSLRRNIYRMNRPVRHKYELFKAS